MSASSALDSTTANAPFDAAASLSLSYAGSDLDATRRRLVRLIERLSGRQAINDATRRFNALEPDEANFYRSAATSLALTVDGRLAPRVAIPSHGPLLIVANHPFGVIDGLAIAAWLERVRDDVRIIVWDAIDLPHYGPHFLPLDLTDTRVGTLRQNVRIRREAQAHLGSGGAILLFPAGCAETARFPWSRPQEGDWTPMAARLLTRTNATALPIFVDGHNSRLFHAASCAGETLRRSLFLHETRRRIGSRVRFVAGEPVTASDLGTRREDEATLTAALRQRTLALAAHLDDRARSGLPERV